MSTLVTAQFGFLWRSVERYVHHNRETTKIGICTALKSVIYFRFVSATTGIEPNTFPSRTQNFIENGKNCARRLSIPDKIDTETKICTFLKSEFYFRYRWPPSTISTLISYISVWVFVTIRGKICPPQSRNNKNRNLHTSKIGNLLPVCLRNNRHWTDHISEPYAKFYGKW